MILSNYQKEKTNKRQIKGKSKKEVQSELLPVK